MSAGLSGRGCNTSSCQCHRNSHKVSTIPGNAEPQLGIGSASSFSVELELGAPGAFMNIDASFSFLFKVADGEPLEQIRTMKYYENLNLPLNKSLHPRKLPGQTDRLKIIMALCKSACIGSRLEVQQVIEVFQAQTTGISPLISQRKLRIKTNVSALGMVVKLAVDTKFRSWPNICSPPTRDGE